MTRHNGGDSKPNKRPTIESQTEDHGLCYCFWWGCFEHGVNFMNLHLVRAQLNGCNGEWTNADDLDNVALQDLARLRREARNRRHQRAITLGFEVARSDRDQLVQLARGIEQFLARPNTRVPPRENGLDTWWATLAGLGNPNRPDFVQADVAMADRIRRLIRERLVAQDRALDGLTMVHPDRRTTDDVTVTLEVNQAIARRVALNGRAQAGTEANPRAQVHFPRRGVEMETQTDPVELEDAEPPDIPHVAIAYAAPVPQPMIAHQQYYVPDDIPDAIAQRMDDPEAIANAIDFRNNEDERIFEAPVVDAIRAVDIQPLLAQIRGPQELAFVGPPYEGPVLANRNGVQPILRINDALRAQIRNRRAVVLRPNHLRNHRRVLPGLGPVAVRQGQAAAARMRLAFARCRVIRWMKGNVRKFIANRLRARMYVQQNLGIPERLLTQNPSVVAGALGGVAATVEAGVLIGSSGPMGHAAMTAVTYALGSFIGHSVIAAGLVAPVVLVAAIPYVLYHRRIAQMREHHQVYGRDTMWERYQEARLQTHFLHPDVASYFNGHNYNGVMDIVVSQEQLRYILQRRSGCSGSSEVALSILNEVRTVYPPVTPRQAQIQLDTVTYCCQYFMIERLLARRRLISDSAVAGRAF